MPPAALRPSNLDRAEGRELYTAAEAVLKGALESEIALSLIAGPRRPPLEGLSELLADDRVQRLIARHGCSILATPEGSRAVALALHEARSQRSAMAAVPSADLDGAMPALERLAGERLAGDAGVVVLLEDDEAAAPSSCPRRAAARLGLPCIEPADLDQLRRSIEQALRLSLASRRALAIVAHGSLLRSVETLEARPNRIVESVDAALALRRRRGPRLTEGMDLLRMARRLELNRHEAMPSPGEVAPIGFIAVGPAQTAIRHVLNDFRLTGRVPVLHMGLVTPIDGAALERLCDRTQEVVLLAPRGGSIGALVAEASERLRCTASHGCRLWLGVAPPDGDASPQRFERDDAVHPSTLARRLLHVLHAVRPALRVGSRLHPSDSTPTPTLPPRSGPTPEARSNAAMRQALVDLARWLPTATGQDGTPPLSALVVDGRPGSAGARRLVLAEVWPHLRFVREGAAAVRQAARDARARLLLVLAETQDDAPDPERLARAAAPGGRGDQLSIESCGLADRGELRERLRAAALRDSATILVVRNDVRDDGSLTNEQAAAIDRLGFQPAQRLVWPAELPCDLRPSLPRSLAEAGGAKAWVPFGNQWRTDRIGGRRGPTFRLRLRPLLERTEVVRTRPPTPLLRLESSARLAPPRPIHSDRGQWRLHCAGLRGPGIGAAMEALSEAGRVMGFHVRCVHDPSPIGAGRRAWAQILFTRPRPDESLALTAQIPFGEADVLLGVDALECMRGAAADPMLHVAAPERTFVVANLALLEDQIDAGVAEIAAPLRSVLAQTCAAERAFVDDLAGPCRAWFLTDRPLDVVLLGAAFQRGLVPVSVEAMEAGLRRLEQRGVARCLDAFGLGRRLAVEDRPSARRVDVPRERISRAIRRQDLELRHARLSRSVRSAYRVLAEETLAAASPLDATASGAVARDDLLVALGRCMAWGGLPYARRYAELVLDLLRAESADAVEFPLTTLAIVPLADAMLIRDLPYVAAMATSLEHRRRVRERLGVRLARGDEVQRRYLNRLDAVAFGWRVRADFRTSDWPARLTAVVGRWLPAQWRGTATDREVRDLVVDLVARAASEASTGARRTSHQVLRSLYTIAESTRLRGVPASELRLTLEQARRSATAAVRPDGATST